MLRMLQGEMVHNFQCTNNREASRWFQFVGSKGAGSLTELDCKKQFDNMHPRDVLRSFTEASDWLYKKHCWRQINVQWPGNKDSPRLDRARQATNSRFWCITHDLLSRLVRFELLHNNGPQAVGGLWHPNGGGGRFPLRVLTYTPCGE